MPKNYQNDELWRDKQKTRMRLTAVCPECDCTVQLYAMERHKRTRKHKMTLVHMNLTKLMQMTVSKEKVSKEDLEKLKSMLG